MAIFYYGNPLIGENTDDLLVDVYSNPRDNIINGRSGNDVLKADLGTLLVHGGGPSDPFLLTDSLDLWNKGEDTGIVNSTTVPHAMFAYDAQASGILQFFVNVTAGAQITLDVDHGDDTTVNTDSKIEIFDAGGNVLFADNDDAGVLDIGSTSFLDSFLQYTFASSGTFLIKVTEFNNGDGSGTNFDIGDNFLLNISVTGQRIGTVLPQIGNDTFYGGEGDDAFYGSGGSDIFYGGFGADAHYGGSGTDTARYDDVTSYGNLTISLANPALNTGAALGDTYSSIENVAGGSGNDTITGNSLVNTLFGLGGNDKLDGAGGADTMQGGVGDDTYYVDLATDKVIEAAGGGTVDQVLTTVDYTLAAGQQIEALLVRTPAGTANIQLIGNELAQKVVGNAGANRLYGGGGNDTLSGLNGIDTLDGQGGHDTLIGGADADRFVFRQAGLSAASSDLITDFSAQDEIWFDTAAGGGAINPTTFVNGTAALGPEDRFIYNQPTGQLSFDADGTGGIGQILLATLGQTSHFALTAADIILF